MKVTNGNCFSQDSTRGTEPVGAKYYRIYHKKFAYEIKKIAYGIVTTEKIDIGHV